MKLQTTLLIYRHRRKQNHEILKCILLVLFLPITLNYEISPVCDFIYSKSMVKMYSTTYRL